MTTTSNSTVQNPDTSIENAILNPPALSSFDHVDESPIDPTTHPRFATKLRNTLKRHSCDLCFLLFIILFNVGLAFYIYFWCEATIFSGSKITALVSHRNTIIAFYGFFWIAGPLSLIFTFPYVFLAFPRLSPWILRLLPRWMCMVIMIITLLVSTAGVWCPYPILFVWHRDAFQNGCEGWDFKALIHTANYRNVNNSLPVVGTATIVSAQSNYTITLIQNQDDTNVYSFSVNTSSKVSPPIPSILINATEETCTYNNITSKYSIPLTGPQPGTTVGPLSFPTLDLEARDPTIPLFPPVNPFYSAP